jgi:hypothetical protein
MVRRNSNKIEPSVMTVSFTGLSAAANTIQREYIDLSQVASLLNRRFYRQGLNWAVAGFKINGNTTGSDVLIGVEKLQNTWTTAGSWEKTMRHWLKQQNDAAKESGTQSTIARFRDYKVLMDSQHVIDYNAAAGDLNATNLIPAGYATGEWEASQVVIPNDGAPGTTGEYVLKMVGASDASAKGIMEGYALSRSVPQSPDPATPALASNSWLASMEDVGDNQTEILDNAQDKNNDLPYPQNDYVGAVFNNLQLHDTVYHTGTTIGRISRLKGGNFPCGLIKLEVVNLGGDSAAFSYSLQIDLVPGNHRGYLAEPMTEM